MLGQVYISQNVEQAARERISWLFDEFENIIVSVSGGKDSTVAAWMTLQEARKRNRKVGIFFIDEEAVYQSTIEQVSWLMNLYPENTVRLWLQFPFKLTNSTSFEDGQLICWEDGRANEWMRAKVPYSIQTKPWAPETETIRNHNKGFGFYDVIENFQRAKTHTAFIVGLRAAESMNRFRAVSKNPGYKDCYWCTKCGGEGSASFYPLYDWNFHDIWKYIDENNIRYSRIYDYQFKKGLATREIRVSSLIHEKSFKSLVELPEFEPDTYNKLCKRINGIGVGRLYGKDKKLLQCKSLPKNFKSWIAYRDFLLETYPDKDKKWIFEKRFANQLNNSYVARQQCRQLILNDYENNLPVDNQPDPREQTIEKWRKLL